MYGKFKSYFTKVCRCLGVFKHPLQDPVNSFDHKFNMQTNRVITLKKVTYTLLIFLTFLLFTNKVSAYSLNDSLENLENITIKPTSDLSTDFTFNNDYIDSSLNEDYNKFYCVVTKNNVNYLLYVYWYKNNGVYDYDYGLLDSSYNSYFNNSGFACGDTTSISKASCKYFPLDQRDYDITNKDRVTIDNLSCTLFYDSGFDFNIVNNTIYTNMSNFYVYSNGNRLDLLNIPSEDPIEEPIEEPTNETTDLSFTNNLLFYLCFMTTFTTLYQVVRNIFVKEW